MQTVMLLLITGVMLNGGAQLLLKAGAKSIGHFEFVASNLIPISIQAALNPYILIGLTCYVLSVALWIMVLSRVDVSFAYPMLSLAYIFTAVAGYYLFDENLSLTRIAGIVVIIFGVFLITRTAT